MEKLQAKGEVDEEELRALEMDVTGKVHYSMSLSTSFLILMAYQIMLASWRGARLEVVRVLREVTIACRMLVNLLNDLKRLLTMC
jgi:hypothetical protein